MLPTCLTGCSGGIATGLARMSEGRNIQIKIWKKNKNVAKKTIEIIFSPNMIFSTSGIIFFEGGA